MPIRQFLSEGCSEQAHMGVSSEKNKNEWLRPVLFFYGKVTGYICGSALLSIFLGKFLGNYFQNDFWIITCIGLGFLVSIYGIYREIKTYKNDLEKEEKNKKENNGNK